MAIEIGASRENTGKESKKTRFVTLPQGAGLFSGPQGTREAQFIKTVDHIIHALVVPGFHFVRRSGSFSSWIEILDSQDGQSPSHYWIHWVPAPKEPGKRQRYHVLKASEGVYVDVDGKCEEDTTLQQKQPPLFSLP